MTQLKILLWIFVIFGSNAFAKCDDAQSQRLMASELYQGQAFRNFACRGAECSEAEFLEGLNFYPHSIDRYGKREACVVDTNVNSKDQYLAVYLTDGLPILQFVHIGGIEFTNKYYKDRVIIYANESFDHATMSRQMLAWNGFEYLPKGNLTKHR